MRTFEFEVNLTATVRVRAADEGAARKVVPTVLGAPGTAEIGMANQNNVAIGHSGTITDVDFFVGAIKSTGQRATRLHHVNSA